MEKIAVFGNGGREAAIAISLANHFEVYGVSAGIANETVLSKAHGNVLLTKSIIGEKERVIDWLKSEGVTCAIVQQDNMLADGVVDYLRLNNIKTFGATQAASRLEWDKAYAIDVIERAGLGKYLPKSRTITEYSDYILNSLSISWENTVVKPNCLTGGKGVKVGDAHFQDEEDVQRYIKSCIENDGSVIVQERISGYEFTIMGITDGVNICFCPPTYDYPYRFDGDTGPGTGGMGCIMDGNLPFLKDSDINECHRIMQSVINYMREKEGVPFEGCINGGFFKTEDGIRFMEFNARLGDPEAHNALAYLGDAFAEQVNSVLGLSDTTFSTIQPNGSLKSFVLYLVSSNYACDGEQKDISFPLDVLTFGMPDNSIRFASAIVNSNNDVEFVGASRSVAIMFTGEEIEYMRAEIIRKCQHIKEFCPDVDFRRDIGHIPFMGLPYDITTDFDKFDSRTAFLMGILEAYHFNIGRDGYDVTNRELSEDEKLQQKLALKDDNDIEVFIPAPYKEWGNSSLLESFSGYDGLLMAFDGNRVVYAGNPLEADDELLYVPYRQGISVSIPVFVVEGKINVGLPSYYADIINSVNTNGTKSVAFSDRERIMITQKTAIKVAKKLLDAKLVDNGVYSVQLIEQKRNKGFVFLEMEPCLGMPEMFTSFGGYANRYFTEESNLEHPIIEAEVCEDGWIVKPADGHIPTRPGWKFKRA